MRSRPSHLPILRLSTISSLQFDAMILHQPFAALASSISPIIVFPLLLHFHATNADNGQCCAVVFRTALHYDSNGNVLQYPFDHTSIEQARNHSAPLSLTMKGCEAFCGAGPRFYSRDDMSESYLTWTLPVLGGLLLQVPFESGGSITTIVLQLARWLGNPVAIFMFTLGNLHAAGRACQQSDRFTSGVCSPVCHVAGNEHIFRVADSPPSESPANSVADQRLITCPANKAAAADLCDGLYILSVLNQYDIQPGDAVETTGPLHRVCYAVLLFALFSCDAADYTTATADQSALAHSESDMLGQNHLVHRLGGLRQQRAQLTSDLLDSQKRSVI